MLSCRDMAPLLSTHSPTAPRGEGGAVRHQRGDAFPTPAGRLYGFRRQRRHLYWRPQGRRTSPAQRYYITPEGGALNPPVRRSRSQAEPWQPRAERPGGWLNPHARKGVSTFGNTGKHRSGPDPDRKAAPFVSRETFQKTQPVHMTRCVFISNFPAGSRWGLRRRR